MEVEPNLKRFRTKSGELIVETYDWDGNKVKIRIPRREGRGTNHEFNREDG